MSIAKESMRTAGMGGSGVPKRAPGHTQRTDRISVALHRADGAGADEWAEE